MSEATPPPVETPAAGEQTEEAKQDYLKLMPQEIQDAVNEIKAKGVNVFMTFLGESGYMFRTLNVMEWMKIQEAQKQRAQAEGASEDYLMQVFYETICIRASLGVIVQDDLGVEKLLPPISRESVKGQPAGIPQSLAQQVMLHSGFDNNPVTIKL